MGDLATHFNRREFACKCGCGFDTVDVIIIRFLTHLRNKLSGFYIHPVRIIINSGCRCIPHNETVQFSKNDRYVPYTSHSQHLFARAVDFKVQVKSSANWYDVPTKEYQRFVFEIDFEDFYIDQHVEFFHVDNRSK